MPTELSNIFGAESTGNFSLHTKSPYLVDLLLVNKGHSAKVNSKQ